MDLSCGYDSFIYYERFVYRLLSVMVTFHATCRKTSLQLFVPFLRHSDKVPEKCAF